MIMKSQLYVQNIAWGANEVVIVVATKSNGDKIFMSNIFLKTIMTFKCLGLQRSYPP
jgi:hypothetical protein